MPFSAWGSGKGRGTSRSNGHHPCPERVRSTWRLLFRGLARNKPGFAHASERSLMSSLLIQHIGSRLLPNLQDGWTCAVRPFLVIRLGPPCKTRAEHSLRPGSTMSSLGVIQAHHENRAPYKTNHRRYTEQPRDDQRRHEVGGGRERQPRLQ